MLAKAAEFFSESEKAIWLAKAGVAAAVAGIVWTLIQTLWLALDWKAPLPDAIDLPTAVVSKAPSASLASWHLFGNAKMLVDPRSVAQNAPTTTLNVTLTGVLSSSDPRKGIAFIADGSGEPRRIRVGEEIQSGVTLDQVFGDRVILNRGGALESLPLREGNSNAAGGAQASVNRPGNATLPQPTTPQNFLADMGRVNGVVVAPNIPAQGIDLDAVRRQYDIDPMKLATAITPMPVMENGQFVGVRLSAGPQQAMLEKLGLRADDIVTAVNGQSITDPSRIQGIVAGLSNASRVSVQIRRNGKTETLTLAVPR